MNPWSVWPRAFNYGLHFCCYKLSIKRLPLVLVLKGWGAEASWGMQVSRGMPLKAVLGLKCPSPSLLLVAGTSASPVSSSMVQNFLELWAQMAFPSLVSVKHFIRVPRKEILVTSSNLLLTTAIFYPLSDGTAVIRCFNQNETLIYRPLMTMAPLTPYSPTNTTGNSAAWNYLIPAQSPSDSYCHPILNINYAPSLVFTMDSKQVSRFTYVHQPIDYTVSPHLLKASVKSPQYWF